MIRLWESHEYDVILGVQLFDRCRMTCCPPHPVKSGHVTERDFQEYLSVIHIRLGLRMSAYRDTKILVTYRFGQGPSTPPFPLRFGRFPADGILCQHCTTLEIGCHCFLLPSLGWKHLEDE